MGSILISFIFIITGRFVQETYRIKVGQIASKTIYAPREIQNKIATENKKGQVAGSMEPQYVINPLVEEEAKEVVELFFSYIEAIKPDREPDPEPNPEPNPEIGRAHV